MVGNPEPAIFLGAARRLDATSDIAIAAMADFEVVC